jgi:hypothetical protein
LAPIEDQASIKDLASIKLCCRLRIAADNVLAPMSGKPQRERTEDFHAQKLDA